MSVVGDGQWMAVSTEMQKPMGQVPKSDTIVVIVVAVAADAAVCADCSERPILNLRERRKRGKGKANLADIAASR